MKTIKKIKIIGLISLLTIIFSVFTFAYYTNTHKFLEEQNNAYVDGFGQKRLAEDFIVNGCGNSTILDTVTGLCWDKNMNHYGSTLIWATDSAYSQPIWNDLSKTYTYPAGKVNYPAFAYCEDLIIDGKDDWRLPTINELLTLVDEIGGGSATCTTLTGFGFINCKENYWSSTEYLPDMFSAWFVSFFESNEHYSDKTVSYYVACVRRD